MNKSSYDDINKTTAPTFMLLRLISVRLGSFAFILCKLASTLVGLGGSSKMGLTFSPFTTSATQDLMKCQPRNIITLAVQFPFRFVLQRPGRVYETTKPASRSMIPVTAAMPFARPVHPELSLEAVVTEAGQHHGQIPPLYTKSLDN